VLNKRDSFNYPSRSTEERLLQYKEFIRIYNSLNIGEKINTNGKASTLKSQIIKKVPGFNYLLSLADNQLSKEGQVPPEAESKEAEKQGSVAEEGQVPPEAESKEAEKQGSVAEEGQVPPGAESKEAEKQGSVAEEGQVPPEAESKEAEKQGSVAEEGQVPPEAKSKEAEKQGSVAEEGQVPPEAESKEAEKQGSMAEEGQVPPEAKVNQPETEKAGQVQHMLETPQEYSTGVEPTTNKDTTVTNVIVEGLSRFLRDSEGNDLLRGGSSDSSYNLSNVQDESWNEDSDDNQDDDQGIDNEKKLKQLVSPFIHTFFFNYKIHEMSNLIYQLSLNRPQWQ
jgi:hypothetical protein